MPGVLRTPTAGIKCSCSSIQAANVPGRRIVWSTEERRSLSEYELFLGRYGKYFGEAYT